MTPFASIDSAHSTVSLRRIWWSVALHAIALFICLAISSIPPAPASAIPTAHHVTLIAPTPTSPPPVLKKTRPAAPKIPLPTSEPQHPAPKPTPREFSSPVRKSPSPPPRPTQIEMPAIPALEPVTPPISLAEPLPSRELPPPPIVVGKLSGAATASVPATTNATPRTAGFSTSSGPAAVTDSKTPRTSNFQGAAVVSATMPRVATRSTTLTRPIEILKKPQPVYTDEARSLRLEGDVSLEVLFTASAEVRVLRVIRGLGHGLDEAAIASASHIQFRPALREGEPINQTVTVHIRFQLAY